MSGDAFFHYSPRTEEVYGLKARDITAWGEAQRAEPQVVVPNISFPPCKGGTWKAGHGHSIPRVPFLKRPVVLRTEQDARWCWRGIGTWQWRPFRAWGVGWVAFLGLRSLHSLQPRL